MRRYSNQMVFSLYRPNHPYMYMKKRFGFQKMEKKLIKLYDINPEKVLGAIIRINRWWDKKEGLGQYSDYVKTVEFDTVIEFHFNVYEEY